MKVILGTLFLMYVPLISIAAEPMLAECDNHLLTVEKDGTYSSGAKKALVEAYRKGEAIRVGWELDWDKDSKVDVSHWTSAQFLSEFEGAIYAQISSIQQQIPSKDKKDIFFPKESRQWFGLLSTKGVLKGRFSGENQVPKQYNVKSIWCLDR